MWCGQTRAENTDPIDIPEQYRESHESAEEESPTGDEAVASPGGLPALLDNLRVDQYAALAGERWMEASQLQNAIMVILEASGGAEPEGLSVRVVVEIRNVCQRLHRWHRNRGSDERAERFRTYVENMTSLMQ